MRTFAPTSAASLYIYMSYSRAPTVLLSDFNVILSKFKSRSHDPDPDLPCDLI